MTPALVFFVSLPETAEVHKAYGASVSALRELSCRVLGFVVGWRVLYYVCIVTRTTVESTNLRPYKSIISLRILGGIIIMCVADCESGFLPRFFF